MPSSFSPPLNQILYGPPGTGKTYSTIEAALAILDPEFLATNHDRPTLKARFDQFVTAGHIRFVTFHQSFSYEDFVEGLRADTGEDGQIRYEVVDGVFKSLCDAATARVTQQAPAPVDITGRRIWKMSLGNTKGEDAYIYDECIKEGYALLGYGELTNFTGCQTREDILKRFHDDGHTDIKLDDYAITAVYTFLLRIKPGDLLVVSDGLTRFRALGEVTGEYKCLNRQNSGDWYGQSRTVKWLRVYSPSLPLDQLMNKQFSQMTLYEPSSDSIDKAKLAQLLGDGVQSSKVLGFLPGERFGQGYKVLRASDEEVVLEKPRGGSLPISMSIIRALQEYLVAGQISIEDIRKGQVFERLPEAEIEKYIVNGYQSLLAALLEAKASSQPAATNPVNAKVLIIDEINRGNVSRIFGELITLIEPSKRAGGAEALTVQLPYSKKPFSVPDNIYLIGTMNTADRSLAGLDIALRRRFVFQEMPPRPELLDEVEVAGINIGELLRIINHRIEALLDRDHCLGHAYFMPLATNESHNLERLALIFRQQILPLLQEYFFEDWQRIQWVLNDHRKEASNCFLIQQDGNANLLFGDDVNLRDQGRHWNINEEAFIRPEAYLGTIDHKSPTLEVRVTREVTYGDHRIRELGTGTIEIWRDNARLDNTIEALRGFAAKLNLDTAYSTGTKLNTRQLGSRIITALEARGE